MGVDHGRAWVVFFVPGRAAADSMITVEPGDMQRVFEMQEDAYGWGQQGQMPVRLREVLGRSDHTGAVAQAARLVREALAGGAAAQR